MDLGLDDPQLLFDLDAFVDDPVPFFRFAHKLYPDGVVPSPTHRFLAELERQGKLRRVWASYCTPWNCDRVFFCLQFGVVV